MMGLKPEELLVSVPYHLLGKLVEAIPRCTAGTAPARPVADFFPGAAGEEA